MSKKTFIILTIIVITLGAILGFSIFRNRPNITPTEEADRPSLFPDLFNRIENSGIFKSGRNEDAPKSIDGEDVNVGEDSNDNRGLGISGLLGPVKLISDPVLGYSVFKEEREVVTPINATPLDEDSVIPSYVFANYPTLKFGDDRVEVSNLKKALSFIYPEEELSESNVFDVRAKEVVQKFQTEKALGSDGIVGSKTRLALDKALDDAGRKDTEASQKEVVTVARYFSAKEGTFFDFVSERGTNTKITQTAFIGAISAIFSAKGDRALVNYLVGDNELRQALLKLGGDGTVSVDGAPEGATFASFSPDGSSILFLEETLSGGAGILKNLSTGIETQVFKTPYSEWLPSWLGQGSIFITTRASSSYKGAGFEIPLSDRNLRRVFRGISGLTTLTKPDGGYILFSDSSSGRPELLILNRQSSETIKTGLQTLPEKCTFASEGEVYCAAPNQIPSGSYPDDWYKGIVQFSDSLWKISLSDGKTNRLRAMSSIINGGVDAVELSYLDGFVYFVDKSERSLWRISVK